MDYAKYIFRKIVKAVSYLHSKNIIYKDINTNNIYFTNDDVVKLGDFGVSIVMENLRDEENYYHGPPSAIINYSKEIFASVESQYKRSPGEILIKFPEDDIKRLLWLLFQMMHTNPENRSQ
ncbi:Serine/Threonine kinase domain protein-like protein, partial [Leptotrombidium deliense]